MTEDEKIRDLILSSCSSVDDSLNMNIPTEISNEEVYKYIDRYQSEFCCSSPISFITSDGIKTMLPNKSYNENLEELH
jgi:hypothetical protein